jgi:hypothetical protein
MMSAKTTLQLINEVFPIPASLNPEENYADALSLARQAGLSVEERPDSLYGTLLVVRNQRGQEFRTSIKTASSVTNLIMNALRQV